MVLFFPGWPRAVNEMDHFETRVSCSPDRSESQYVDENDIELLKLLSAGIIGVNHSAWLMCWRWNLGLHECWASTLQLIYVPSLTLNSDPPLPSS